MCEQCEKTKPKPQEQETRGKRKERRLGQTWVDNLMECMRMKPLQRSTLNLNNASYIYIRAFTHMRACTYIAIYKHSHMQVTRRYADNWV
jgi:hypothetical protein